MVPAATPQWIQNLIPGVLWRIPSKEAVIYITFDDGPIPEITPWVLAELDKYNAKASFFCIGKNVAENPEIFAAVKGAGHLIGNHTQNHLNGWKTSKARYLENIAECQNWVNSAFFRPPYGKATKAQMQHLKNQYKLVLWSVLSKDYDQSISSEKCFKNSLKCKAGDIIVFHDSLKASKHLFEVLPKFLKHYSDLGFQFKALPQT